MRLKTEDAPYGYMENISRFEVKGGPKFANTYIWELCYYVHETQTIYFNL